MRQEGNLNDRPFLYEVKKIAGKREKEKERKRTEVKRVVMKVMCPVC